MSTSLVPPAAKGCRDVCRDNGRTGRGAEAEEASECVIEASRGLRWIGGLCVQPVAAGVTGEGGRACGERQAGGMSRNPCPIPPASDKPAGQERACSGRGAARMLPCHEICGRPPENARLLAGSGPCSLAPDGAICLEHRNGWAESTRRKRHPGAVMMFGAPNRLMTSGSELDLSANWQVWGSARMTKQPWRLGSPKDKTRPHGEKTGNAASRQKSSNWPWAAFQAFAVGPLWLGTTITHTTAQTCYRSLSILVTLPRRAKTTHASNHPTHSLAD